jgi:hypothetical protein
MSKFRLLIPALLLFAAVPSVSEAQTSIPLYKTTYCVQVKYEYWRNGVTFWSTVLSTSNQTNAVLMHDLLLDALEDGDICEMMNCGFDFIITDVRLTVKREYIRLEPLPYQRLNFYQSLR